MDFTPEMDREAIKRMGHSLIAYSRLRSLKKMSKGQLADMPKEVMISCAANEIASVWEILPKHLQEDIDILKYKYCYEHHMDNASVGTSNSSDVNDGPIPRKLFCCYCTIDDCNIGANNNQIELGHTMPPRKRRKLYHMCCEQQ